MAYSLWVRFQTPLVIGLRQDGNSQTEEHRHPTEPEMSGETVTSPGRREAADVRFPLADTDWQIPTGLHRALSSCSLERSGRLQAESETAVPAEVRARLCG